MSLAWNQYRNVTWFNTKGLDELFTTSMTTRASCLDVPCWQAASITSLQVVVQGPAPAAPPAPPPPLRPPIPLARPPAPPTELTPPAPREPAAPRPPDPPTFPALPAAAPALPPVPTTPPEPEPMEPPL